MDVSCTMKKGKSSKIASIELDFTTNTDDSDMDCQSKQNALMSVNGPTLHQCARYNDVDCLKQHISQGTESINKRDKNGISPLHHAARYNHLEAVVLLVKKGNADPTIKDNDNATPLHYIARKRQIHENRETGEVVKFLASCADVNAKDKYQSTPLHFAAVRGNVVVARALLKCRDILVNAKDALGCTPLHDAATYGHVDVAELLIYHGARLLQTDKDKCTALHLASLEGRINMIQLLINKADTRFVNQMVNMTDAEEMTALHYAVESQNVECVKLLLLHNSLSNAPCRLKSSGSSPLHLAAIEDVPVIGQLLIAHGADVTARDNSQATPLHKAAEYMSIGMTRVLLANVNINIEVRDNEGYTPLLSSVCYPCVETVQLLLDEDASTEPTQQTERNILHLAVEWQQASVLTVLMAHLAQLSKLPVMINDHDKFGETPLHVSAHVGNLNIFKILLHNSADIYQKNEDEETAMLIAVRRGHFELVKELLERSEKVLNDEDEQSNSALHIASQHGHTSIVKLLCEHGADMAMRNSNHKCPVDIAAENGYMEIVEYFIDEGAALEAEDKEMETALQLASFNGHDHVVRFLITKGADICRPNRNGQTSFEIAIYKGHRPVVETIISSTRWQEAFFHETVYKDGKPRQTPLRLLIAKMPDLACTALNNMLEVNCLDETPDAELVKCQLSILDDTYTNYQKELRRLKEDNDLNSTTSKKEPYTRDSAWVKENHPLMKMVNAKQTRVLLHPVALALIRHKWNIAQKFYIIFLLYYAFFLAVYTSVMMTAVGPHQQGNCSDTDHDNVHDTLRLLVYIMAATGLMLEGAQFISRLLTYFTEPANYLDMFCYIASIITVTNKCYTVSEKWKWELAAVTLLALWINFLLFLRRIPTLGIYVVMLTEIIKTFLRIVVIFLLFIVAFGLSFYMLLEPQEPFSSPGKSIMKAFIMMLGELEYTSIFFPESEDSLPYSAVTYVIFIFFLIIMAIILMNLLVGLAVEDVSELRKNAMLTTLAMQINLALDVELSLPKAAITLFHVNPTNVELYMKEPKTMLTRFYASSLRIIDGELLSEKTIAVRAKSIVDENYSETQVEDKHICPCANQLQSLNSRIDTLITFLKKS